MSELETLEEIAEQTAFGNGGLSLHGAGGIHVGRPKATHCGQGHELNAENTRTYKQGKRTRRICRVCDKDRATAKRRVRYSAREYPL